MAPPSEKEEDIWKSRWGHPFALNPDNVVERPERSEVS